MYLFARAAVFLAVTMSGLSGALADNHPTGECSLNADNSTIALLVSNGGDTNYACSASCQYKITGQRPVQTFKCNYALGADTPEKTACHLDGGSANHFSEVRPTKFVCEPH